MSMRFHNGPAQFSKDEAAYHYYVCACFDIDVKPFTHAEWELAGCPTGDFLYTSVLEDRKNEQQSNT